MGLLEKAMNYKNEINRKGGATLIDRIQGPADTSFQQPADNLENLSVEDSGSMLNADSGGEEIVFLTKEELLEVNSDEETITDKFDKPVSTPTETITENLPVKNRLQLAADDESDDKEPNRVESQDKPITADVSGDRAETEMPSSTQLFSDSMVLYETDQEILNAGTMEDLTDTILFLVMGQLGATSSSLLLPDSEKYDMWIIKDSRGIKAVHRELSFKSNSGILGDLLRDKKIIDIDIYRKNRDYSEDYISFLSIDTRVIAPLITRNEITAILILGEKISGDEYTEEDYSFLESVGRASAMALRNILVADWSYRELSSLEEEVRVNEMVRDSVTLLNRAEHFQEIEALMGPLFSSASLSYSVYVRPEFTEAFMKTVSDTPGARDELIEGSPAAKRILASAVLSINEGDPLFESFIVKNENSRFRSSLYVYPVRSAGIVKGALVISGSGIDSRYARFISGINNNIVLTCGEIYHRSSTASLRGFDYIMRTIQKELDNCVALNIPLTLLMMSIKNYKRIFNRKGMDSVTELFNSIERLIGSRISDGDISMRYDRNKILFILPGKDRHFASPFSAALKNDIQASWKESETVPLITFLSSQFPEDGSTVYSLMEPLEQ